MLWFRVCWQGVTLTDLKEAEKTAGRAAEPPARCVQPVSPIITVTPAERGEWASRPPGQALGSLTEFR